MNHLLPVSRVLGLAAMLSIGTGVSFATAVPIPHGTVDLISETQAVRPGTKFYVGLHFKLEKGWHIYWQNPGDSGQPPRAEWKLPAGMTAGAMEWPTPHRMGSATIVDYGYNDEVTILVPMKSAAAKPADKTAQIGAALKLLICREICVPGKAQLELAIPVQEQTAPANSETKSLFDSTRKLLPRPVPASWNVKVSDTVDSFVLSATPGSPAKSATFFPSRESQVDNTSPQKLTPLAAGFRLALHKSDELLKPIDRLQGVLVLDDGVGYSIDAPVSHGAAPRK